MKRDFLGKVSNIIFDRNIKRRVIFDDNNSIDPEKEIKYIKDLNEIDSSRKYYCFFTDNFHLENKFKGIIFSKEVIDIINEHDIIELFPLKQDEIIVKRIFRSDSEDNVLFLTNKCNSNCRFCPDSDELRKNLKEYIEENIELIDLLPSTLKHMGITGGEPTILKENFFRILKHCKEKLPNIDYTIISNGRMFFYKDFCQEYINNRPINTKVAIAIHNYNENSHDYITQVKGSFRQTFLGIKNLLSLNERIELRIVLNKTNYDNLDKIANLIVTNFKGIEEVNILSLELLGNAGKNYKDFWIEKDKINNSLERALPIFMKNKIKVNLYNFPLCLLKNEFWEITKKSITDYKSKYGIECENCKVFSKCDGFFFSTFNVIQPNIKPIQ